MEIVGLFNFVKDNVKLFFDRVYLYWMKYVMQIGWCYLI